VAIGMWQALLEEGAIAHGELKIFMMLLRGI
jgi:hypothetical protein